MQVNPNVEYNKEDAGLTLDDANSKSVDQADSSDTKDEADLVAAENVQKTEKGQKSVSSVKGSQVISTPMQAKQLKKDDRFIAASCMLAGVMCAVIAYFALIYI